MLEPTDQNVLRRYLLGDLPQAEIERMDELSVTDDEFSDRLLTAEDDLVDAYIHQELDEPSLARFKAHYQNSVRRRQKVQFAEDFAAFAARTRAVTMKPERKPR